MSDSTLIFIHVPKTAGTSFYDLIERNYDVKSRFVFNINKGKNPIPKLLRRARKNNIRIIYGHGTFGLHEIFPDSTYITFVREPISHAVSLYNYVKTSPHSYQHERVKYLSFKEFVLNLKDLRMDNPHYRQFTNTLFRIVHSEFYEKEIRPDIDYLEYALKKIQYMYRFEDMSRAIKAIAEMFKWRHAELPYLNVSNKTDFKIDEEDIESLKSVNHLDYYIYDRAIKLSNDDL